MHLITPGLRYSAALAAGGKGSPAAREPLAEAASAKGPGTDGMRLSARSAANGEASAGPIDNGNNDCPPLHVFRTAVIFDMNGAVTCAVGCTRPPGKRLDQILHAWATAQGVGREGPAVNDHPTPCCS